MSRLRQAAEDYLVLRRSLGYSLQQDGRRLLEFVAFLDRSEHSNLTTDAALAWATGAPTSGAAARRLATVRGFAKFFHAIDPRTEIPPKGLLPHRPGRRIPYVYSDADIRALLETTRALRGHLRPSTYATLFGLLATTGMRVGEAMMLDRTDYDSREALVIVRNGKFGKSRQVPLHATASTALKAYATERDQVFPRPKSPSFLLSEAGTRLLRQNVHETFLRLLDRAGLADRKPHRPRIHDLRHSFAIRTLEDWYREGVDVESKLPRLSTYLGHTGPASTYWYLSATPELLGLAAERLGRSLGETS